MTTDATDPQARRGVDGFFALFVDRPVLTLMVTAALVMLGLVAFLGLPLRFAPDGLTENRIRMFIPVRQDMSPQEVEDRVIEPLEELLRTIPGLREVRSSASSNRAFVSVTLDPGMDPTLASAEVRDRAQRARLQWPPEVDRYFTWKEDASNIPLAFFQLLTPDRTPQWDYLVDEVVRPRLESVEGVGRVELWGLLAETVRIWFDRDKLYAHNVRFFELVQRLRADNYTEPLGEIDNGSERVLLRLEGKFRSLSELEQYPVRPGLTLGDVARIERVPTVRDRLSRFNRKYTYSGLIRTAAGISPVDASRNLHAAVAALREDGRLADIEVRFLFDQGESIKESLNTLLTTSLEGGALALVALFLFVRHVRFTIAIALSIPLALLIVGVWLFFAGDSLNLLTMTGMTLAVGMVVDNSVVVLESIRRRRELGDSLRVACVHGAREVGLAVSMATLTTVVVFLPMVFMSDSPQARIIMGSLGIPLSVALLGSLAVALLLLPSGVRNLGGAADRFGTGQPTRWSPVGMLTRLNQAVLRRALRHRVLATVAGVVLLAFTSLPARMLDFAQGEGGMFRSGDVTVNLDLPRGMTLSMVEGEVKAWEDHLFDHRDEWHIDSVSTRFSRTDARLDVKLRDDVAKGDIADLRKKIEQSWPRRPGVEVRLSGREDDRGGSEETSERNFVLRLYGRDSAYLMRLAREVTDGIAELPQVESVEIPAMTDGTEVVLDIRRDALVDLRVQPETLFGMVSSGLQGQLVTNLEEEEREVRVIAEFDAERNPSLLDLKETDVWSDLGDFQRLGNLADVRFANVMSDIDRLDGRTNVTIVGRRQTGVGPAEFSDLLAEVMRRFPLPRGYSWTEDSVFRSQQEQIDELLSAFALSVTLVFLLMAILFESVILPGAILVTVPFAVFGALWSLVIFWGSIDPMAVIGIILLAGVVVNNGIVLLDCIVRLRRDGMSRFEAILEGTRIRLRPILMTATTTIVGLLPMALFGESTGQGISYVSMSIAVSGGLAFTTVFTALAVPVAYTWFDDLTRWGRRVWVRGISPRR